MEKETSKAKSFFKLLINIHSTIGKVFTTICIMLFISALIGLMFGTTKCSPNHTPEITCHFLNEEVLVHDDYLANVESAKTVNSITILNKNKSEETIEGNIIQVSLNLSQNKDSKRKSRKLDKDDFKLKNHTGVYVPLNDIGSLVGWDMIDVHYDKQDNGYLMSSVDFKTKDSIKDYNYIGLELYPGVNLDLTINFLLLEGYKVEEEIMVVEIDFFRTKTGEDIVLQNNPFLDGNPN